MKHSRKNQRKTRKLQKGGYIIRFLTTLTSWLFNTNTSADKKEEIILESAQIIKDKSIPKEKKANKLWKIIRKYIPFLQKEDVEQALSPKSDSEKNISNKSASKVVINNPILPLEKLAINNQIDEVANDSIINNQSRPLSNELAISNNLKEKGDPLYYTRFTALTYIHYLGENVTNYVDYFLLFFAVNFNRTTSLAETIIVTPQRFYDEALELKYPRLVTKYIDSHKMHHKDRPYLLIPFKYEDNYGFLIIKTLKNQYVTITYDLIIESIIKKSMPKEYNRKKKGLYKATSKQQLNQFLLLTCTYNFLTELDKFKFNQTPTYVNITTFFYNLMNPLFASNDYAYIFFENKELQPRPFHNIPPFVKNALNAKELK